MDELARFLASLWSVETPAFAVAVGGAVWLFKTWPYWKQRINDARKIELDAHAGIRGDLLERIRSLETRCDAEPARLDAAIMAERHRCEGEMTDMRRDFEKRIEELMRIITQNSQSTAQYLGLGPHEPDGERDR